ncbi:hypothetical protein l11_07970 [Neisseria weaveri LMG 5135]|nr:hypothetical protein l13_20390 [Neisseria weaveri ATCC 51223]EGV38059.1 hypothetical protein l11_07970 [Neisseria weaveri LMG 5135]
MQPFKHKAPRKTVKSDGNTIKFRKNAAKPCQNADLSYILKT